MTNNLSWPERHAFAEAALCATASVFNGIVCPVWLDDLNFWYERRDASGAQYCIVHAESGERRATVAREALVSALQERLNAPVEPAELIVTNPRFTLDHAFFEFDAFGDSYQWSLGDGTLQAIEKRADANWTPSPDSSQALILRDDNLVLHNVADGKECSLTRDGSTFYAYGALPAPLRVLRTEFGGETPEALWSPDGQRILTLQTDDRHVPELSMAEYAPAEGVRPKVHLNKTSLPADPKVTEFRMIAVDVKTGKQVEARYPRLSAVRMNSTPFGAGLAWWSADSRTAYFVDIQRGERNAHVVAFDVETGSTRVVFSEQSDSYVEVSVNVYTPALIAPLASTNELVWYSERTGRGHLYLYDLSTGELRHPITSGPWQIREVLSIDAARREVFFLAAGIAEAENPYITKPCVASLDGGNVRILSDLHGEHRVWRPEEMALGLKRLEGLDPRKVRGLSPSGDYFVETVSTVRDLPTTYLRRRNGEQIAILEKATFDAPPNWQPPEPLQCKAADGITDVFGLLYKPLGYDPDVRYPLIDYIYGGPQIANVPQASFAAGGMDSMPYLEGMHLSALGAFVLILDGRGTANREQAFRTASHRAAHTASNLEDHVAAIQQLATAHPQIDLDRVGITGFSGGGYMTAHAALRFGDFFKVAVAGGGNYDQALFWHSWGERYHGEFDGEHYASQAAKTYAAGMTGKLMLVHGLMDAGCHPAGLFQLVQALIEANKDPDLVLLPRAGHDWTGYGVRRRWDYFATNLIGSTPPPSQPFKRPTDMLLARFKANASKPQAKA
jgi:dipeptidyl-peptidase 4